MTLKRAHQAVCPIAAWTAAAAVILGAGPAATIEHAGGVGLYEGLSEANRARAEENLQTALETQPSQSRLSWRRTDGAWGGSVMPIRTFRIESGAYCREFQEDVIDSQQPRRATLIACRDPNGTWVWVGGSDGTAKP